jgi:hypothetical protein
VVSAQISTSGCWCRWWPPAWHDCGRSVFSGGVAHCRWKCTLQMVEHYNHLGTFQILACIPSSCRHHHFLLYQLFTLNSQAVSISILHQAGLGPKQEQKSLMGHKHCACTSAGCWQSPLTRQMPSHCCCCCWQQQSARSFSRRLYKRCCLPLEYRRYWCAWTTGLGAAVAPSFCSSTHHAHAA